MMQCVHFDAGHAARFLCRDFMGLNTPKDTALDVLTSPDRENAAVAPERPRNSALINSAKQFPLDDARSH